MTRRLTSHPLTHRSARSTRRTLAAAASALLLAATAACGGGGSDEGSGESTSGQDSEAVAEGQSQVSVAGDFDAMPDVTVKTPLEVSESSSWVADEGDGDEVAPTATVILGLTIVNGKTGKTAISTYQEGQAPLELNLTQQVVPALVDGIVGQRAKSRVVVAATAEDAYGPQGSPQIGLEPGDAVVIVADILSTDPTDSLDAPDGTEQDLPQAAPTLEESDGVPTGFSVPTPKPPAEAATYTLLEGDGPPIEDPDRVRLNYLGEVWGGDEPFDGSYARGEATTFSIGTGGVIPCWDDGLEGVTEGSRVILVCPPGVAYGDAGQGDIPPSSTLVFVVDVLGVG